MEEKRCVVTGTGPRIGRALAGEIADRDGARRHPERRLNGRTCRPSLLRG
jgi:NAD(P)-dependent dehydrogenase (short-subunit alcohol dehydrogenase family)